MNTSYPRRSLSDRSIFLISLILIGKYLIFFHLAMKLRMISDVGCISMIPNFILFQSSICLLSLCAESALLLLQNEGSLFYRLARGYLNSIFIFHNIVVAYKQKFPWSGKWTFQKYFSHCFFSVIVINCCVDRRLLLLYFPS